MGYQTKSADVDGDVVTKVEMTAELKKLTGEVKNMMQALESKAADTRANAEKALANYDEHAAKFNEKWLAAEAAKKAVEEKLAAIETEAKAAGAKAGDLDKVLKDLMVKMATGGGEGEKKDLRDTEEYKSAFDVLLAPLNSWQLKQAQYLQTKTLRTDSSPDGGFLVPDAFDIEIRKKVTETSPIRALARKRPLPGKTLNVSIRNRLMGASFEGETKPAGATNSRYGQSKITAHRQTATVIITLDQLMSTPVAMEAELASDAGESFANNEGFVFCKGTGNGMPMGFIKDGRVDVRTSAASGTVTFDDVADLIGDLKSGYFGVLGFNRKTLAYLRKIKDSMNRPLWQPVADGKPATIYDEPYSDKFIDLDDASAGSGAIPIVYADWQRFYEIYDAIGMMVVRDDLTLADEAMIKYVFRRYLDGKVILAEAGKILKVQ